MTEPRVRSSIPQLPPQTPPDGAGAPATPPDVDAALRAFAAKYHRSVESLSPAQRETLAWVLSQADGAAKAEVWIALDYCGVGLVRHDPQTFERVFGDALRL